MASLAQDTSVENLPQFPLPRRPMDPPAAFDAFRKAPWLTAVRMWNGQRAWLVTRYDDVRKLLSDPRVSANPATPGFPSVSESRAALFNQAEYPPFIRLDGEAHARIRKMLLPEFSIRRVEGWRQEIDRISNALIDAMVAGPQPADFVQSFALPLPSIVLAYLLGVPEEDRDFFHDVTQRMAAIGQSPEQIAVADREYRDYIRRLIAAKRADMSSDDLTTRIIRDQVLPGHLSEEEFCSTIQILFIAGHETTANTLSLAAILLTEHPDQYRALAQSDDPDFVRNAVEELLRHTSVVQYQCMRAATADIEFRGEVIRKGDGILPMIHGANRDDTRFDDPDRFDIGRKVKSPQVAFGFGPHQCLGQALARLELAIALPLLARRLPALRLAGTPEDVVFKGQGITHGADKLMVRW